MPSREQWLKLCFDIGSLLLFLYTQGKRPLRKIKSLITGK